KRSVSPGGVVGRRTLPSPVLPWLARLSLVAATSAAAHLQNALDNTAADIQRSSWLPAPGSLPAGSALLPKPPESHPLAFASAAPASTRLAIAPLVDTCALSWHPCPLWPLLFPNSLPLSPRQTTSSPVCL